MSWRLLLTIACAILSGCSTTEYAKIHAYGVHAITPYGIISMGVLEYERAAKPNVNESQPPEIWIVPPREEPQQASQL